MFFIKYKYEQKPNTINKWVGLQVSGLLSIPLPNFTEGDGDGELMKLGRNKSIIIQTKRYPIFVLLSFGGVPHTYLLSQWKAIIIRIGLKHLSECLWAGMDHLHINVMLNDVPHKSQNNQDSNAEHGIFSGCILSLVLSYFARSTFYCKWFRRTFWSADQFRFVQRSQCCRFAISPLLVLVLRIISSSYAGSDVTCSDVCVNTLCYDCQTHPISLMTSHILLWRFLPQLQ